jgi:lipopolysaccharide transport system ATP-binding protein
MSRSEINRKFDEIVDFSGVEKFLDTPVKRYSSGMYVRLAFAVAAHLEPEILIVDEVLAVGDAEFQKKCLGKMQDVAGQGRTVLFVSHNMAAVQAMCKVGILLSQGSVAAGGSVTEVMRTYAATSESAFEFSRAKPQSQRLAVTQAKAFLDNEILIELTIESDIVTTCAIEIIITDATGAPVGLASLGGWRPQSMTAVEQGSTKRVVKIPTDGLASGRYKFVIALTNPGVEYYDLSPHELEVDYQRTLLDGETRALSQSEGFGSMRIRAELLS